MRALKLAATALLCSQLSGCFFIFIPGSVVGKISDGITGAEGEHCVGREAVVGGRIRMPSGEIMTIKSLSGTSVRCNDARYPIRAALALEATQVAAAPVALKTQAQVNEEERRAVCRHFIRTERDNDTARLGDARLAMVGIKATPEDCYALVGRDVK